MAYISVKSMWYRCPEMHTFRSKVDFFRNLANISY